MVSGEIHQNHLALVGFTSQFALADSLSFVIKALTMDDFLLFYLFSGNPMWASRPVR